MASRFRTTLLWVPKRVRKEFATRGKDTVFLVWVAFIVAFAWARTWVTVIGKNVPNLTWHDEFTFGRHIIIAGYHPHHIALGVLLLAIAGWMGIFFAGKQVHRIAGVMYGIGLGLIVDELGFIVDGMTPYKNDWDEVFVVAILLTGLFMSVVYFRSFWTSLESRLRFAFRRHRRRQIVKVPAPSAPVSSVGPAPAPAEPDERPPP